MNCTWDSVRQKMMSPLEVLPGLLLPFVAFDGLLGNPQRQDVERNSNHDNAPQTIAEDTNWSN